MTAVSTFLQHLKCNLVYFLPHELVLSSLFFSKVKVVWNTKSGYIIVRLMKASTKLGLNNFQHKWLEVDVETVWTVSIKLNLLHCYYSDCRHFLIYWFTLITYLTFIRLGIEDKNNLLKIYFTLTCNFWVTLADEAKWRFVIKIQAREAMV